MVQVIPPSPRAMQNGQIGQAIGQGFGRNFQDPQQRLQEERLSQAMSKIPKNAKPIEIYKALAPIMISTPGGSSLLESMVPVLNAENKSDALTDIYQQEKKRHDEKTNVSNQGQGQTTGGPKAGGRDVNVTGNKTNAGAVDQVGEDFYRNPQVRKGPESTYPKMPATPEDKPNLSPEQQAELRYELSQNYRQRGQPVDDVAISNYIANKDNEITKFNEQNQIARNKRETAQDKQTKQQLTRFKNGHLNATPQEEIVFEKFTNEARDAASGADQYEYANEKYKRYETAKSGLIREGSLPNFIEKIYQKSIGTYKSKEQLMKDIQPQLNKFRELGLHDEAREILSGIIGLGMEDTELAMFPPSKDESNLYNNFPTNPEAKKIATGIPHEMERMPTFPGEESALKPEGFNKFKNELANILEKYPKTNLVALRGVLNQDKKYAWTDISTAVAELIDEGRFQPDAIQEDQLNVVKAPPISGLGQIFMNFWTGTK